MRLAEIIAASVLGAVAVVAPAWPAEAVNEAYVRSLAVPGKTVLVVEYYDAGGKVVARKGYVSATGYQVTSPTDFRVDETVSLHLFGIEACDGAMVNRREAYAGTCAAFARQEFEVAVKAAKVIFCRAFLTEQTAPVQDATCYGYYHFPGSLDSVNMIEEQLVSIGSHRVARKTDGSPSREDLLKAEKIGRQGYGMWADPRIQHQ